MHERLRTGGKAGRDFRTSVSCHILTPIAMISIFLLCLSSVSFAQGAESLFLGVLPTWWILLAGAFAIGFGLAAIAYMASTVFRLPELSVWAKSEVGEMVATGLIVGILLIAVTAADGIFKAATGQTAMEQTLSFTNDITNKQMEVYFDSLEISKAIGLIAGNPPQYATGGGSSGAAEKKGASVEETQTSGTKGGGITIPVLIMSITNIDVNKQIYHGLGVFQSFFGLIQSSVISAAGISIVLQMIASLVKDIAIPVLMPLGVFFSCFAITRKMGRTFIAFGIGLYFFFPAAIMISKAMYCSAFKSSGSLGPCSAETAIPAINKPNLPFVGSTVEGMQYLKMKIGLLTLIPEVLGPIPFVLPCFLLLPLIPVGPALFAACFNFMWNVFWPTYAKVALHYLEPAAIAAINVYTLHAAGVPDSLAAQTLIPGYGEFAAFRAQFPIETRAAGEVSDMVMANTPYMLQYSVPIVLMTVIVLLILITSIRSVSPAIGGEVQILGVSELI